MMLNPDPLAVLRLKLRRAGYFPIPCEGKAPPLKGWQDAFNTNAEEISLWSKSWHMARNTGVLAKHTPALDIDLMDEDACEAIETLVGQLFEDGRVLVRIGKAPKRLIPFRTSVPFKKLILAVTAPNGVKSKLEVLGDGQHYVVDGIHPETRAAYCWHGADHLADVPVRDLPLIRDAAHAQEVLDRIGQMLVAEHGYTLEQKQQQQQDDDHPRGDPADWAELMRRILTGTDIHDAMVSLSASHASCGMPLEGSTRTLRSLLLASALPRDERFRERINDVERTVRSGYAKFAPPTEQEATPALDCDPWWRDPATIPPRQFLHGKHYSRRNIGASIGAGGRLKTSHGLFEATEMAVGYSLTTKEALPAGPLRVIHLSGEEDQDELDRQLAALMQHYGVTKSELGGRLFVKSVRNQPLRFATLERGMPKLNQAALGALGDFIKQHRIDVFMLDPWVSFHAVRESDNCDMDLLIKQGLGGIANETNSAGEIFHHPGKPKPGQADTTVEDARGASALIAAVRSARVFNFMTSDEATKLGVAEPDRRKHIRIANGKANLGPIGSADWIKIEVENLPNGDEVACVTLWSPPNPFDGVSVDAAERAAKVAQGDAYRADVQSPQWFGWKLAEMLGIPVRYNADNDQAQLARVKNIIKTWVKNNVLEVVERQDEGQRRPKKYVVAGPASAAHKVTSPAAAVELDDEVLL